MMRRRVRRRDERTTRPPSAIVAPGRLLARTCTLPRPHGTVEAGGGLARRPLATPAAPLIPPAQPPVPPKPDSIF